MIDLNTYITERIGFYAPGREDGGAATLKAIQRRDFATLEPQAVLIIVGQVITYLHTRHNVLQMEENRLQGLQPVNATTYYRRDHHGAKRYLYLNHPSHNAHPRKRQYIGADPARQTAALARLQAYKDLVVVQEQLREVNHRLDAITGHLARSLLAATKGVDRIW